MDRYQPPRALEWVPDVVMAFGYVWAGLMFLSAVVNVAVALTFGLVAWASFMSVYGLASKLGLFVVQYTVSRSIGVRRARRREAAIAVQAGA